MNKDTILTQKNRPALVKYGAVMIAIILWYSFMWDPINAKLEEKQSTLATQELKIAHLKKRISRLKGIEKRLVAEKKRLEQMKKRLVPGDNPQQVSTNIQNSFLKKASDAGMDVLVYRSGPKRRWREYQLAVSVFNIRGTTKQFVELLEKIELGKQLLRLNNLNISNLRGKASQLRVNLEVEALFIGKKAEL